MKHKVKRIHFVGIGEPVFFETPLPTGSDMKHKVKRIHFVGNGEPVFSNCRSRLDRT